MFIRKKKYNALLEQKEDFERIAMNAVAQNGRLLEEWDIAIKDMKGIQELNHQLVNRNDELLARVKELEAKLNFAIKQRDYYYDLLENTEGVHVGDVVVKEAE
jgi:spore coat polysaccharide biosynthesis predicted glycosyltransferase SpsG